MKPANLALIFLSAILLAGCIHTGSLVNQENESLTPPKEQSKNMQNLKLTSKAFDNKQMIPKKYTCDGEDMSPPLKIEEIPEGTQSLVLIVDDPDAPGRVWVHWLVWNIPPQFSDIPEGSPPPSSLQGENDFGKEGYGGPCPPPGAPHRYFFKLYALDSIIEIEKGANKATLENAMEGHIISQTELIGLYGRGQ